MCSSDLRESDRWRGNREGETEIEKERERKRGREKERERKSDRKRTGGIGVERDGARAK